MYQNMGNIKHFYYKQKYDGGLMLRVGPTMINFVSITSRILVAGFCYCYSELSSTITIHFTEKYSKVSLNKKKKGFILVLIKSCSSP